MSVNHRNPLRTASRQLPSTILIPSEARELVGELQSSVGGLVPQFGILHAELSRIANEMLTVYTRLHDCPSSQSTFLIERGELSELSCSGASSIEIRARLREVSRSYLFDLSLCLASNRLSLREMRIERDDSPLRSIGRARLEQKPAAAPPTTCVGCLNYYGKTHGGNRLICAMHPHGAVDDYCPDFELEKNVA
jgi:hypothetical protein